MMPKKKTVTVEDLIRLKRAEHPPVEFWAQFDRELRTKQLAAIIEPRPWWAPFIRVTAKLSHYQVPVGAAAILALSFVAVREYRTTDLNLPYAAETEAAAMVNEPASTTPALNTATASRVAVLAPAAHQIDATPAVMGDEPAEATTQVGYASHAVALPEPSPAKAEPTPSARYIAANLAAAQAADPRLVDDVFGSPVRTVQTREPVRDPLAQIGAPGEARRSRLLESALPVAASANVTVGTSDRVARRLTEERLYDTISRIGLKGDRVAFKF